ncbi:MAG: nitrophenyl compound nitroreductase subunit ArsF family protein [Dehalococcoidia bacterium]|nr:nitrophenyl compound nitroreductase subunit ArsF family protein [Dehalococcoidia bacterium]
MISCCSCTATSDNDQQAGQTAVPMVETPAVTTPPVKPSDSTGMEQSLQPTTPPLRTDVIYTHMTQRCKTCLCFESRIKWVIDKYYTDEIDSGKLTFLIINAQDKKNVDLVNKYGVVGSQLFINTVVDGKDHIRDVSEIWNWDCNNDPPGFCEKVQDAIDRSLEGKY